MWRAWPMPSAKIVAQKPAGNAKPLSSFGQASLFATATGWAGLRAWTSEMSTPMATNTTMRDSKVLDELDSAMTPPRAADERVRSARKLENKPMAQGLQPSHWARVSRVASLEGRPYKTVL